MNMKKPGPPEKLSQNSAVEKRSCGASCRGTSVGAGGRGCLGAGDRRPTRRGGCFFARRVAAARCGNYRVPVKPNPCSRIGVAPVSDFDFLAGNERFASARQPRSTANDFLRWRLARRRSDAGGRLDGRGLYCRDSVKRNMGMLKIVGKAWRTASTPPLRAVSWF
jgi:hypothetical protein